MPPMENQMHEDSLICNLLGILSIQIDRKTL